MAVHTPKTQCRPVPHSAAPYLVMGLLKAVRGGLGGGVDLLVAVVAERACVGACACVCLCVRGCVLSRAVVHVIIKCMLCLGGRTPPLHQPLHALPKFDDSVAQSARLTCMHAGRRVVHGTTE